MRAKTRVLDIASIEIKLNSGAPLMDIERAKNRVQPHPRFRPALSGRSRPTVP